MEVKDKISKLGYKLTRSRLGVLNFLEKANKPYSAQEIHNKLNKTDLVSVYRTLSLLAKIGVVNEEFFNKEKKYCLNNRPHHHIVCRNCNKVESVECNHNWSNSFKNFKDIDHKLILTGICMKCQNKK